jgi:hypothetical protein
MIEDYLSRYKALFYGDFKAELSKFIEGGHK